MRFLYHAGDPTVHQVNRVSMGNDWRLAAAAPAIVGALFVLTGRIHPAIVGYHLLCVIAVAARRDRVRTLLGRDRSTVRWILGTTAAIAGALLIGPLVQDPTPYRATFRETLFPWGKPELTFVLFAVYTLLVHAPLEEIFWRGAVLDPATPGTRRAIAANGILFFVLHAVPLAMVLGPRGILLALPTLAAGAIWAFVTIRSRSLWPGLVSHWGADALILAGMWFYFIR